MSKGLGLGCPCDYETGEKLDRAGNCLEFTHLERCPSELDAHVPGVLSEASR